MFSKRKQEASKSANENPFPKGRKLYPKLLSMFKYLPRESNVFCVDLDENMWWCTLLSRRGYFFSCIVNIFQYLFTSEQILFCSKLGFPLSNLKCPSPQGNWNIWKSMLGIWKESVSLKD